MPIDILATLGILTGWSIAAALCMISAVFSIPGNGTGTRGLRVLRWAFALCACGATALALWGLIAVWA